MGADLVRSAVGDALAVAEHRDVVGRRNTSGISCSIRTMEHEGWSRAHASSSASLSRSVDRQPCRRLVREQQLGAGMQVRAPSRRASAPGRASSQRRPRASCAGRDRRAARRATRADRRRRGACAAGGRSRGSRRSSGSRTARDAGTSAGAHPAHALRGGATDRPAEDLDTARGRTVPATTFTSVLLPAPFGPMSAWMPPRWTSIETPSSATTPPKVTRTSRALSAGMVG